MWTVGGLWVRCECAEFGCCVGYLVCEFPPTLLLCSQFTAPMMPIVQPPVPAPPPTTTASLGSKVPLSKEEFLRLQKAARKTER